MHQFEFIVVISLRIRDLISEYRQNTTRNPHVKIELMHQNESMRTLIGFRVAARDEAFAQRATMEEAKVAA
jgi:hypothetical protein